MTKQEKINALANRVEGLNRILMMCLFIFLYLLVEFLCITKQINIFANKPYGCTFLITLSSQLLRYSCLFECLFDPITSFEKKKAFETVLSCLRRILVRFSLSRMKTFDLRKKLLSQKRNEKSNIMQKEAIR